MKHSINLKFRPSTKQGSHPGRLFFRIIHSRQVVHISTEYQIFPEEWDRKKNCIIVPETESPRTKDLLQIHKVLKTKKEEMSKQISSLYQNGYQNIHEWKNSHCVKDKEKFISVYGNYLIHKLNKAGQERTARAYQSVLKDILRFNKNKDMLFSQLTESLLKQYEKEMKENGKSLNTISFYMRNLRAIYNKAQKKGIIQPQLQNPFRNVYTGVASTHKRALSKADIILLNKVFLIVNPQASQDINIPSEVFADKYQQTLTYFFFSFYSRGMSFVDMAYLQKKNIAENTFSYYRKKTGSYLKIKITPILRIIIEQMEKKHINSPYLFPIIKNSQEAERLQYESALRIYNQRLKKIGTILGIKYPLTSHVSRHSWASIAKHENLPLWVISESLGHSNEQTTYIYLSSLDHSMLDEANEKITNAIKNGFNHKLL